MEQNSSPEELIFGCNYSFNKGIAITCGINAAIIFNHILYWLEQNLDKPHVQKEGRVWTYQTQKEMAKKLGFLSEKEVRNAIKILCDKGLLIKGNFNESSWDHKNWYTVNDRSLVPYKENEIVVTKRPQGRIDTDQPGASESLPGLNIYNEERLNKKNKKEEVEEEKGKGKPSPKTPPLRPQPIFMDENKTHFVIPKDMIKLMKKSYPDLNLEETLNEAFAHALLLQEDRPCWRRFISDWLKVEMKKRR